MSDADRPYERNRFERFLMAIMGPAQIGDLRAPLTYTPDERSTLCGKCGHSYDRHERVHSSVTYLDCPR